MNAIVTSLISRPALALEAVRAGLAFRARGAVLPARDVIRWRVATAYGTADAAIDPDDLNRFLLWRRAVRQSQ